MADLIPVVDADDFIDRVTTASRQGFGFTPLFGSGMSAASGILMGMEFDSYLAYAVYCGLTHDRPWDFRRDGWPPYPSSESYQKAQEWVHSQFQELCQRNQYEVVPGALPHQVRRVSLGKVQDPDRLLVRTLSRPPVPAVIRSPDYQGDDDELQRLAATLRRCDQRTIAYEPLWPRLDESPTSHTRLIELAIRSLCDWRMTLDFLSRIVRSDQRSTTPLLLASDKSVKDRFNTFITSDKQPNLGHKMLVHLSRPLRIRTVLTTNFDTLIEDAFQQAHMELSKFSVSNLGELPDPFLVRSRASIIKMHGELLETRSDLSLDDEPSDQDKRKFLEYFFDADARSRRLSSTPSHLLVAGFSARDLRIIRLIQHLLDSTRNERDAVQPTVFWICATLGDVQRMSRYFPTDVYPARILVHQTARPDLLLHQLYQHLTLSLPGDGLTYEYSHNVPPNRHGTVRFNEWEFPDLTLALEDGATRIETALRSPEPPHTEIRREARDAVAHIAGHTISANQTNPPRHDRVQPDFMQLYCVANGKDLKPQSDPYSLKPKHRVMNPDDGTETPHPSAPIVVVDMAFGMLEALSIPHSRFLQRPGRQCLWFELADYLSADSLLRDILRAIALRIGRFQREQVTLHPLNQRLGDRLDQEEELTDYLASMCGVNNISAADWKIFIYGREVAGSCVGWLGTPWAAHDWENLATLLRAFAGAGFPIVYAIPTASRNNREQAKWSEVTEKWNAKVEKLRAKNRQLHVEYDRFIADYLEPQKSEREQVKVPDYASSIPDSLNYKNLSLFDSMIEFLNKECQSDRRFEEFLYAVSLFRQSRRPSALYYEAVQVCPHRFNLEGIDNDQLRARRAAEWTKTLQEQGIFYRKAGGHLWIHRDIRVITREFLDRSLIGRESCSEVPASFHGKHLARTHFWIGEWYFKAFCSTGFVLPIIECLHHRFQSALIARFAIPKAIAVKPSPSKTPDRPDELDCYRFALLRSSILEMIKTLVVARPYLKLWLANEYGMDMFKKGGAIHNAWQTGDARSAQRAQEVTIRELLIRDVDIPNTGRAETASDFLRPFPEHWGEIDRQIDLLVATVEETDRAICEEASIDRAAITINPSACRALERQVEIDLENLMKRLYDDDWERWQKETVDNSLRAIFQQDDAQASHVSLLEFKFLDQKGQFDKTAYAEAKGEALAALGPSFKALFPLLSFLGELTYAHLRRAKFLVHSHPDPRIASFHPEVRKAWLIVTQLCNLGIDWCKHLPAEHLQAEMQLKARLHSFYAVALANLDRFFESHRHLNEASAINSKREIALRGVELAKIRLRRAEVFLTEAHRIYAVTRRVAELVSQRTQHLNLRSEVADLSAKHQLAMAQGRERAKAERTPAELVEALRTVHPGVLAVVPDAKITPEQAATVVDDLVRVLVATLDNAWAHLEFAERSLSGQSQSNLWWGRLATMKLRAFAYQRPQAANVDVPSDTHMKMLAYRHRQINPQALWQIFEGSYLNNQRCHYRALRLIRYIAEAFHVCLQFNDGWSFIDGKFKNLKKKLDAKKGPLKRKPNSKRLRQIMRNVEASVGKLDKLLEPYRCRSGDTSAQPR